MLRNTESPSGTTTLNTVPSKDYTSNADVCTYTFGFMILKGCASVLET
jgi:hypothetical protein